MTVTERQRRAKRRINPWLAERLALFYVARQQWEDTRDRVSKMYATEMAEFERDNPRPQLRDFLRDGRKAA